jgi:hypothetical protein
LASGEACTLAKKSVKKTVLRRRVSAICRRIRHLKGLDMVEQVLEHLDILCTVSARDLEQIPEHGPLVIIANHRPVRWTAWRCCTPFPACAAMLKS